MGIRSIAFRKLAARCGSLGSVFGWGELLFRVMGRRGGEGGSGLSEVRRVIVVRLDEIGDVLMTTPFLREIRHQLPRSAWVTLLVKPGVHNLVELCPYANEVLSFAWPGGGRLKWWRYRNVLRFVGRELWPRSFDLAIVPRWDVDYYRATLTAYLTGARRRVGYSESVNAEKGRLNRGSDQLFTDAFQESTVKHEVERNLDVIRFMGGRIQDSRLEVWLSPEDEVFASRTLACRGVRDSEVIIALGVGAGARKRMWPVANFVELGTRLRAGRRARLLVLGGSAEEALGQELERQLTDGVINVAGRTSLRQAAALLRRCRLYAGNDSGPMHLAAAVGVPVVEISCHPRDGAALHPNAPRRFGPWGVPHRVLQPESGRGACMEACRADQAHCILGITVEQVEEAAESLLVREIA